MFFAVLEYNGNDFLGATYFNDLMECMKFVEHVNALRNSYLIVEKHFHDKDGCTDYEIIWESEE